jgi:hypothetical protein
MFIVTEESYSNKGVGRILGRYDTLADARRKAYASVSSSQNITLRVFNIYDDSMVKPIVFIPTGQKLKNTLGEKIAEVHKHGAGAFEGTVFYYPSYDSQYYKKRNAKYHKYILHRDGSLGQGMW